MQGSNWIRQKDSKEDTLDNLKHSLARVLALMDHAGVQIHTIPASWLGTLDEIYPYRKKGFVPPIAERKDNDIVFYYEIIYDVINEINDEMEIEKFIESVCMHEILHVLLRHKSDTEENRQNAEVDANLWMTQHALQFQEVFEKYMPVADEICRKRQKQNS